MEPFKRRGRPGWYIRYRDGDGRWVKCKGGDTKREAYAALERAQMRSRAVREGWVDPQAEQTLKAS